MAAQPLRILLADDHAAVRKGIRALVESNPQWTVCGEARNGREAVEQARHHQPDLALVDMSMPEINGLEAARQIVQHTAHTRVLVLTMQTAAELDAEVRRTGAERVVLKSDPDAIVEAIEQLGPAETAIHLGGAVVRTRHVAGLFATEEERYRVLAPFVAEGLARGERAFHIVDHADHAGHVDQLTQWGAAMGGAAARQFELVAWEEMYLRGGTFDQQAMLARIQDVLRQTPHAGFPLTRLVANMEWALQNLPGVEDLAEYESRLNYVLPGFEDVVVCTYDLSRFNGRVIVDVMRAHPAVVIGGTLRQNAFYVPPDQLIEELRRRKREG